ncbi:anti-anti-sigma factor [Streptomyces maremycinicus]|nr:anti-anti-sigma factor [Streptomyces sp. B9173]
MVGVVHRSRKPAHHPDRNPRHGGGRPRPQARPQALKAADSAGPARLVVDLSGVSFMDSSGINVFVAAHHAVTATDGWIRIAPAQEPVLRPLQMVGVNAIITCHPTLEEALQP